MAFDMIARGCGHYVKKQKLSPVITELLSERIFQNLPASTLVVEADYASNFALEASRTLQSEVIRECLEFLFVK